MDSIIDARSHPTMRPYTKTSTAAAHNFWGSFEDKISQTKF